MEMIRYFKKILLGSIQYESCAMEINISCFGIIKFYRPSKKAPQGKRWDVQLDFV
jgi:hypothetical protein